MYIIFYLCFVFEIFILKSIVNFLDEEYHENEMATKINLKIASMSFINSLLFNGSGEVTLLVC
jgi:hypothetical protein